MKLAIGSDECTHLTDSVLEMLRKRGHELLLYGALTADTTPESILWPHVAYRRKLPDADRGD